MRPADNGPCTRLRDAGGDRVVGAWHAVGRADPPSRPRDAIGGMRGGDGGGPSAGQHSRHAPVFAICSVCDRWPGHDTGESDCSARRAVRRCAESRRQWLALLKHPPASRYCRSTRRPSAGHVRLDRRNNGHARCDCWRALGSPGHSAGSNENRFAGNRVLPPAMFFRILSGLARPSAPGDDGPSGAGNGTTRTLQMAR